LGVIWGGGCCSVIVADFNGDGIQDLEAYSPMDGLNFTILLGNGDGTFTAKPIASTDKNCCEVATADFNGDGIPDLAVGTSGNILLSKGTGLLRYAVRLKGRILGRGLQ
jgi:hypothetical protein